MNVLVLHGPNLGLRLERQGFSLERLNAELAERAPKLDAAVKCVQANSEGALIDALYTHRAWLNAVIVNPGALAPHSMALAETLTLFQVPAIEALLEKLPKTQPVSALAEAVEAQLHGQGVQCYFDALDKLAGASGKQTAKSKIPLRVLTAPKKTIGRKANESGFVRDQARTEKTMGRKAKSPPKEKEAGGVVTRAQVRAQLALRLNGTLTPQAFATWARGQWQAVQSNAPVEPGQRELLEDTLLLLAASTRASDDALLTHMAKLDSSS